VGSAKRRCLAPGYLRALTDEGGEAACFANLLCPECGAVLDGGPHRDGCRYAAVDDEDDASLDVGDDPDEA
jgi:hypothetical protein